MYVYFSLSVVSFSWFGSFIPSVMCRFPFFITSMANFLKPNSIPMSGQSILTACIIVTSPFSFFANSLMSSMYIRWLIFSWDVISLYPAVHFLGVWLNWIVAIINSNGDSASPRNLPHWIFASAKLLPPNVNSPGFHGFLDKVHDFWYLVHFERV